MQLPQVDTDTQLGAYRIIQRLASGGMGTVYVAQRMDWTRDFAQPVAIKVMHPHLSHEASFVRMFLDEARVAMQISHAHVCSVIEVGVINNAHFLVMEYLHGKTLGRLIRETAQSTVPGTSPVFYEMYQHYIARVTADAATGLHAAHETRSREGAPLQVVHRDVSPHNIMVTYTGMVKVLDFGVAHARERLEKTQSGLVKGKLKYASPEQLRGDQVDRRTDVWALGVCLWEAVTLQHPFPQNDQSELVAAILTHRLPDLRKVAPWIHPELERILLRALSKDPSLRFRTAKEMSTALRAYLFSAGIVVEATELAEWLEDSNPGPPPSLPRTTVEEAISLSGLSSEPAFAGPPTPTEPLKRPTAQAETVADRLQPPPEPEPAPPVAQASQPRPALWLATATAALVISLCGMLLAGTLSRASSTAAVATPAPVQLPPEPPPAAPIAVSEQEEVPPAEPTVPVEPAPQPVKTAGSAKPVKAPAVPKTGLLSVSATGGHVQVWIDGSLRGSSPLKLELPAGTHQVKLIDPTSGESTVQTVNFVAGVERTMQVRLDE